MELLILSCKCKATTTTPNFERVHLYPAAYRWCRPLRGPARSAGSARSSRRRRSPRCTPYSWRSAVAASSRRAARAPVQHSSHVSSSRRTTAVTAARLGATQQSLRHVSTQHWLSAENGVEIGAHMRSEELTSGPPLTRCACILGLCSVGCRFNSKTSPLRRCLSTFLLGAFAGALAEGVSSCLAML